MSDTLAGGPPMTARHWVGIALLIGLGIARIASTYRVFNETYDEPWHLSAGMEFLQFGTYTYEQKHPPLGRLAMSVGPYLAGARLPAHREVQRDGENILYEDGNAVLHSGDRYWRNLTLARLGMLPFFAVLCVVTFLWASRWFGEATGWWALLFATSTPVLLGHAGVATTDLPGAAGTIAAMYQFLRWLEDRSTRRSVWLGLAVAAAVLGKMSSVGFLGAALPLAWLVWIWKSPRSNTRWMKPGLIAAATALVAMWACYGFTLQPLAAQWGPHPRVDAILEQRAWLRPLWNLAFETPLPLSEVILGVRDVMRHNAIGYESYLLGEFSRFGWWYFFPVVLAVRTPIGMLILAAIGGVLVIRATEQVAARRMTLACFAAVLGVGMAANLNAGARHLLAIFPLLAILAGHAAATLLAPLVDRLRNHSAARLSWKPVAALLCAATVAITPVLAQPDYLAYFNLLAGEHPERILAESDLDWGQDLHRLSERLKDLHVDQLSIAYFGSDLLHKAGLPPYHELDPGTPSSGWIAISVHRLYIDHARDGSYDWLKRYTPRERVGKSIDLFYLPESADH